MKIHSRNIINGYLEDKIGSRGTEFLKSMPTRSFQVAWEDLPADTQSLALVFIDYDSIPVCGFPWIHWTVANIDPSLQELPENASQTMKLLEGVNSWASGLLPEAWKLSPEEATSFGGCAPPDQTHRYHIKMLALDTMLDLKRGFFLNELQKAMEGHILAKTKINALYTPKE